MASILRAPFDRPSRVRTLPLSVVRVPGGASDDRILAAARRAIPELVRVSSAIDPLAARFRDSGHELYLVGGPVRDALLGRSTTDLDFTTDARPDEDDRHRIRHGGSPDRRASL